MRAMLLERLVSLADEAQPLRLRSVPEPEPGPGEILLHVSTCGVCHTELDEIEGRTPPPHLPVIPGHQVVGRVAARGVNATRYPIGERLGVAWIYSACGQCKFCLSGRENLCAGFRATGRDVHGGYAEYLCVPEAYTYPIPPIFSDAQAAPLLCAGAIGYRSLRLTGVLDGQALGLSGFGASAHLVLLMARAKFPNVSVFVFSRSPAEQKFALELGAAWCGDFDATPPVKLDCLIETTPAWKPVLSGLRHLESGGRLVINAIRKESGDQQVLTELDYSAHLWLEKEIKSVANITRQDVTEFLALAAQIPLQPEIQSYELTEANQALLEMKQRKIRGAKVLHIG